MPRGVYGLIACHCQAPRRASYVPHAQRKLHALGSKFPLAGSKLGWQADGRLSLSTAPSPIPAIIGDDD